MLAKKRKRIATVCAVVAVGALTLSACGSGGDRGFGAQLQQEIQPLWTVNTAPVGSTNYTVGDRIITTTLTTLPEGSTVYTVAYDIADGKEVWKRPLDADRFKSPRPVFVEGEDGRILLLNVKGNPPTERSVDGESWSGITSDSLVLLDSQTGEEVATLTLPDSDLNRFYFIGSLGNQIMLMVQKWQTDPAGPTFDEYGNIDTWKAGYYDSVWYALDQEQLEQGLYDQALVPLDKTSLANETGSGGTFGEEWVTMEDQTGTQNLFFIDDLHDKTVIDDPKVAERLTNKEGYVKNSEDGEISYFSYSFDGAESPESREVPLSEWENVIYRSDGSIVQEKNGTFAVSLIESRQVEISGDATVAYDSDTTNFTVSGEDLTFTAIDLKTDETLWETTVKGNTEWLQNSYISPLGYISLLVDGKAVVLDGKDGKEQSISEDATLLCFDVEKTALARPESLSSSADPTTNVVSYYACDAEMKRIDNPQWSVGTVEIGNWWIVTLGDEEQNDGEQSNSDTEPRKVAVTLGDTINLFELPPSTDES